MLTGKGLRKTLSVFLGIAAGALLIVTGCGSNSTSASDGGSGGVGCTEANATATTSVTVKDYSFDPACIKVSAGDKVTWTNTGMSSHTVTSDSGAAASFDSGALGSAGTFSFTFTTAGTVGYHCTPHQSQGMVGTVVVQ